MNRVNYPETVKGFIDSRSFYSTAKNVALYNGGGKLMCINDVYDMISHYFNAKSKSGDLSAEDFVKAININIDALMNSIKEKEDTTSIMASMMLEYTKRFINEFVDTAVVKTEDEKVKSDSKEEDANDLDHIRPTDLKDTVPFMVSSNYEERFKAEYYQLKIRTEKLEDMVDKWDKEELDFTPTCPRSIYDLQIRAMKDYLAILEARAKIEGVEL